MLNNFVLKILIIFLFVACSSVKKSDFQIKEQKDLVDEFSLDKKQFDKFKVEKEEPVNFKFKKKRKIKKTKITKKKKSAKSRSKVLKKKVVVKAINPGKTNLQTMVGYLVKNDNKVEEPAVEEFVEETFSYPEDYPKNYVAYDKQSLAVWNQFAPFFFPGEEFHMDISYLGITAGHIKLKTFPIVKVGETPVFKFRGHMKSAKFYEYIYKLDDYVESYIDVEDFLPVKYTLIQRETNQNVSDLQLFDREALKTFFWYKRLKKGKKKNVEKETYVPRYFQDSFSALYFVRGLPLKKGDVYEFPIITRAKMWILKMEIVAYEKIKVMGRYTDAIRIKAETHFPGVLKKKGDILFWYSNDATRKLLKFQANVKIGAVKGILVDYLPGKKVSE